MEENKSKLGFKGKLLFLNTRRWSTEPTPDWCEEICYLDKGIVMFEFNSDCEKMFDLVLKYE